MKNNIINTFDLETAVCDNKTKVKFYPYRTARPSIWIVSMEANEATEEIERALARKVKVRPDNHTTYEVTLEDNSSFVLHFSDGKMLFGIGVKKERW